MEGERKVIGGGQPSHGLIDIGGYPFPFRGGRGEILAVIPPSQILGQHTALLSQPVDLCMAFYIPLMCPRGTVPGAHSGADIPQVVEHSAHFHSHRPSHIFGNLVNKAGAVVVLKIPAL